VSLQRQRLVLVVPLGHRLAARRRARLDELADEEFLTVPAGFGFRSLIDDLLAADGVSVRVSFESADWPPPKGWSGPGLA
jgi:LysR family transcriptional regulator, transcription activator of glutamate synthase operon